MEKIRSLSEWIIADERIFSLTRRKGEDMGSDDKKEKK